MKFARKLFLLPIMASIILTGCDTSQLTEEPDLVDKTQVSEPETGLKDTNTNTRVTSLVLAGFTVEYQGQVFDGTHTTFTYLVSGPDKNMKFRAELPECAPDNPAFDPTNGHTGSTDALINPGVEWVPPTVTGPWTFKIIYTGFVKEGLIEVYVKSNNTTELGLITGACARIFDIAGKVFTDGDDDFLLDPNETGIEGATLNLLDDTGSFLTTTKSDENGDYIFTDVVQGDYRVEVDPNSVAETGIKYIEPLITNLDVSVGPDASGINFGFAPKTGAIVKDLKDKVLLTSGENLKFWKDQVNTAITGKGGPVTYDKDQLVALINIIKTLGLTGAGDPYFVGLTDQEALQAALDILSTKSNASDLEVLIALVLSAEFNQAAGLGLEDLELQEFLINWGETIIVNAQAIGSSAEKGTTATSRTSGDLGDALNVFGTMDKSSGGGGAGN